jgi:hypothetical protein
MRSLFIVFGTITFALLASPLAEAKNDMQCTLEARRVTGEYDGLEFTQAKTACILDARPRIGVQPELVVIPETSRTEVVIPETSRTQVAFSHSRRVSSGIWVRVSPNRWVLRAD